MLFSGGSEQVILKYKIDMKRLESAKHCTQCLQTVSMASTYHSGEKIGGHFSALLEEKVLVIVEGR